MAAASTPSSLSFEMRGYLFKIKSHIKKSPIRKTKTLKIHKEEVPAHTMQQGLTVGDISAGLEAAWAVCSHAYVGSGDQAALHTTSSA